MAPLKWFPRFGDIPGVTYTTPPGIDRHRLHGADARPEVVRYAADGEGLSWPRQEGSTSASPAHERAFGSDLSQLSTTAVISHLSETLELPGEATDYHFAIQGVLEALWRRRRTEPAVLTHVEHLAWLDIDLIRARPIYYRILAFQYLITLYEREGAWRDALDVAELSVHFGQQQPKRDELADRVAALDAEERG